MFLYFFSDSSWEYLPCCLLLNTLINRDWEDKSTLCRSNWSTLQSAASRGQGGVGGRQEDWATNVKDRGSLHIACHGAGRHTNCYCCYGMQRRSWGSGSHRGSLADCRTRVFPSPNPSFLISFHISEQQGFCCTEYVAFSVGKVLPQGVLGCHNDWGTLLLFRGHGPSLPSCLAINMRIPKTHCRHPVQLLNVLSDTHVGEKLSIIIWA